MIGATTESLPPVRAHRRLVAGLAACILVALFVTRAAANPNGVQPFHLVSETWTYSQNPDAPLDCLNEDDVHAHVWAGSFSGTFTSTELLCDPGGDNTNWDAGGVGIYARLLSTRKAHEIETFGSLSVTSPTGQVYPSALWSTTKLKGNKLIYDYGVCVDPRTDNHILAGGTWTITVSGTFSDASYLEMGVMAPWVLDPAHCP